MIRHHALLLAAGGSTRLGRAKQLLRIDGETLVHRVARLLAETQPVRTVVVVGARADVIRTELLDLDVAVVLNATWTDGLASSLRAAKSAFDRVSAPVLVAGCDQPALQGHHLAALLAGAERARTGVAATSCARRAGIPAVVPSAWFGDALPTGDSGFSGRLRAIPESALFLLDAPELTFDLDTTEQAAAAAAARWIDPL